MEKIESIEDFKKALQLVKDKKMTTDHYEKIRGNLPMWIHTAGRFCDSDSLPSTYDKSHWLVVDGKRFIKEKKIVEDKLTEDNDPVTFTFAGVLE